MPQGFTDQEWKVEIARLKALDESEKPVDSPAPVAKKIEVVKKVKQVTVKKPTKKTKRKSR